MLCYKTYIKIYTRYALNSSRRYRMRNSLGLYRNSYFFLSSFFTIRVEVIQFAKVVQESSNIVDVVGRHMHSSSLFRVPRANRRRIVAKVVFLYFLSQSTSLWACVCVRVCTLYAARQRIYIITYLFIYVYIYCSGRVIHPLHVRWPFRCPLFPIRDGAIKTSAEKTQLVSVLDVSVNDVVPP